MLFLQRNSSILPLDTLSQAWIGPFIQTLGDEEEANEQNHNDDCWHRPFLGRTKRQLLLAPMPKFHDKEKTRAPRKARRRAKSFLE